MKSDPAVEMTKSSSRAVLPPGWSELETLSTVGLAQAVVGIQEKTAAAGDWVKEAGEEEQ